MGCNESKEAVATSNTISRRPFRKKSSIKAKDLDPIPENNVHIITAKTNSNDDVKDISINTELNKDGQKQEEEEQKQQQEEQQQQQQHQEEKVDPQEQPANSISSPDHFFSSRKDSDVADESVIDTEEGYYSPHHDSVKDGEVKDGIELKEEEGDEKVVEEKSLDDEQPETSLVNEENKTEDEEKGNLEDMKEPESIEEDGVKVSETPAVTIVYNDKSNDVESEELSSDTSTKAVEIN